MSAPRSTIYTTTKGYLANNAVTLQKVAGLGPLIAIAMQDVGEPDKLGRADGIVSAWKINPTTGVAGRAMKSTTATAVTDESTGYSGDGHTLVFTGQTLNNLPVVPRSVAIHNDADDGIIAYDGGDGKFYTNDADLDVCGLIDYFTGAMTFSFPAGKAPAAGALDAAYYYETIAVKAYGRRSFTWESITPQDIVVVAGACAATDIDSKACHSTLVHTDIIVCGDAQSLGGL